MPINTALFPQSINAAAQPMQTGFGRFTDSGVLGSAYAPFMPGSGGPFQESLKLTLPRERLDDRRQLRLELDRIRRTVDVRGQAEGLDKFQEQALDTILRGVADAFDLSQEDPKVVARYDAEVTKLKPDASRGQIVFQKACIACHKGDDIHRGRRPACAQCHTTNRFSERLPGK